MTNQQEADQPKRKKFGRRKYWIDTRLQLSVVGLVLILGLFNAVSMYMVHAIMVNNLMTDIGLVDPPARRFLAGVVGAQSATTLKTILWLSLLTVGMMTFGGVLLSHGIAGPIYAIRKKVKATLRGKYEGPIRLRKHDFLWELSAEVNELMDVARGEKKFENASADASPEPETKRVASPAEVE